jgi:hypothetical protein
MPIYRVVFKDKLGNLRHKDYPHVRALLRDYKQVAVEEDSFTLRLHGEPVLKGLVGPLSEGRNIVRYETPEVFELVTDRWSASARRRLVDLDD